MARSSLPSSKQVRSLGPADLPEFLTIAEVAERLRVSERTAHRWLADGELIAHQFGRAVRIATTDFARFVAARRSR
jgi:excisionase family DNA binding protein